MALMPLLRRCEGPHLVEVAPLEVGKVDHVKIHAVHVQHVRRRAQVVDHHFDHLGRLVGREDGRAGRAASALGVQQRRHGSAPRAPRAVVVHVPPRVPQRLGVGFHVGGCEDAQVDDEALVGCGGLRLR
eukprot:1891653-Prymnesium_polylepis.1